MISKMIIPAFLITLSLPALAVKRIVCPKASDVVPEGKSLSDYQSFLSANKIIPKTNLSLNFLEQFKNEFEKFPSSLHQELIKAGNKIHIMEGTGVTADPTWDPNDVFTFDGRPWSNVPGGGGSTARGYSKTPTRIVINHLYDHHGSTDMFLHEHGHSLDSIVDLHGISHSPVWADLLAAEPATQSFLTVICGTYCTANIEEGFAELFANYHGCAESREQMEQEIPRTAEFFKRFTSTKNLDHIWEDAPVVTEVEVETAATAQVTSAQITPVEVPVSAPRESRADRVRRRVRDIFGRIFHGDDTH